MPLLALNEASTAITAATKSIRVLGPITVAFFVLLGFILFALTSFLGDAKNVHNMILDDISKIDEKVSSIKNDNAVASYFYRQICQNTAQNEAQRSACNPPPGLLSAQDHVR